MSNATSTDRVVTWIREWIAERGLAPSTVEASIYASAPTSIINRAFRQLVAAGELVEVPSRVDAYRVPGPDDDSPAPAPHPVDVTSGRARRRDPMHTRAPASHNLDGAREAQRTLRTLLADHECMSDDVKAGIRSALADLSRTVR